MAPSPRATIVVAAMLMCCVTIPATADPAEQCKTDEDCSLNGVCDATSGACTCDPQWAGDAACAVLQITPSDPVSTTMPAYGYHPNVTSWGGTAVFSTSDGQYHLFVSEMADDYPGHFCGLHEWQSHSRIAHAVSTSAGGPYTKVGVALPQQAHNASPLLAKDGTLYLFHIGTGSGDPVKNCTESTAVGDATPDAVVGRTRMAPGGSDESALGGLGSVVHVSRSGPWGPWEALPFPTACNNPAPLQHPNGTFYVICKSPGHFAMKRAENITAGLWTDVVALSAPPAWSTRDIHAEDPYLWVDHRGNWHLLSHIYDFLDGCQNATQHPVLVAGHAFSADGLKWQFSDTPPYGNVVRYSDGSTQSFATMERPHLVFDPQTGQPTHLFNGVSPVWDSDDPDGPCGPCLKRTDCVHECSSCKVTPGYDWTYTLARQLSMSAL